MGDPPKWLFFLKIPLKWMMWRYPHSRKPPYYNMADTAIPHRAEAAWSAPFWMFILQSFVEPEPVNVY